MWWRRWGPTWSARANSRGVCVFSRTCVVLPNPNPFLKSRGRRVCETSGTPHHQGDVDLRGTRTLTPLRGALHHETSVGVRSCVVVYSSRHPFPDPNVRNLVDPRGSFGGGFRSHGWSCPYFVNTFKSVSRDSNLMYICFFLSTIIQWTLRQCLCLRPQDGSQDQTDLTSQRDLYSETHYFGPLRGRFVPVNQ